MEVNAMNIYICNYFALIVFILGCEHAYAYSSGAGMSACVSFTPSHGTNPGTSDSPFVVLLSQTSYTAGEVIEVRLEARCGEQFKGFLLQARRADPTTDQDELIGTFTPVTGTKTQCDNADGTNRGLTHDSAALKSLLTVQWTAPTPATGHIIFRATFVKAFATFFVDVRSAVLSDPTAPVLSVNESSLEGEATIAPCVTTDSGTTDSGTGVTSVTTTAATSSGISRDDECGTSLGCFDDCGTMCTFSVTWAEDWDNIRFSLKALSTGNSYIGIGFSTDRNMGGDSVAECVVVNGVVRVFQSYNTGYSNARLPAPEAGISDVTGSVTNGVFTCSFLRITGGTGSLSFNLSSNWFLFAARGSANGDFSINKHASLPQSTGSVVDFQAFTVSGATSLQFALVKAHGALMCLSWLLFAGVGLVIARFYKPMWPNTTVAGAKLWFQIHRGCMVATLLCTVIAFILIFVEAEGYSQEFEKGYQNAHPVMGIIVTILVIINPIMAIFRPSPTSEKRPIFNWLHFFVGKGAYILAVITTFFGLTMAKAKAPDYSLYILASYCVWQVLVEISLELIRWRGKSKEGERVGDEDTSHDKTSSISTANNVVLFLHTTVVIALSFALVGILATVE